MLTPQQIYLKQSLEKRNKLIETYKTECTKIQKVFEKICQDRNYEYILPEKTRYIELNIPEFRKFNKNQRVEKILIDISVDHKNQQIILEYYANNFEHKIALHNSLNISYVIYSILDEYLNHIYLFTKHYLEEKELMKTFREFQNKLIDPAYIRDLKIKKILE
jgi:hypothetical protein